MKQGDIVTIYYDPITCERPEGKAKLIALEQDDPDLPRWLVRFLMDDPDMIVSRLVSVAALLVCVAVLAGCTPIF